MLIQKIPYRARIPGEQLRPLVSVDIDKIGTVVCILDSGADTTTMPIAIAEKAGIDVKRRGTKGVSECAHGHESVSYETAIKATILGETVFLLVSFIEDGREPALLGRKVFFDKYKITFDELNKEVAFERNPE